MSPPLEPSVPLPGDVLAGKYVVERVVSAGRTTVLVEAQHQLLDTPVTVALLRRSEATEDEVDTFVANAHAVARVRSAHAAQLLDVGELEDGVPYVAMEQLDGIDLDELVATQGPLPLDAAVDLVLQMLEALAVAHARGVTHRNLQPACLLLLDAHRCCGLLKVLSFQGPHGLAGFSAYTAPEQVADPRGVDPRSDGWSAGAVLYTLLTGSTPFAGATPDELAAAISSRAPVRPRWRRAEIPVTLEAIIVRCLERAPSARYANVGDLAVALAPFGTGAEAVTVSMTQAALAEPKRTRPRSVSR